MSLFLGGSFSSCPETEGDAPVNPLTTTEPKCLLHVWISLALPVNEGGASFCYLSPECPPHSQSEGKMAAALPLLLLCSLLHVAGAQHSYFNLTTVHKEGVELALRHVHQTASPFHYRFYETEATSETETAGGEKYVRQRLSLKPTTCAKGTVDSEQTCSYRNDRAMMDCAVCYRSALDQIQQTPEPYVHCVLKPRLTDVRASLMPSSKNDSPVKRYRATEGRSVTASKYYLDPFP